MTSFSEPGRFKGVSLSLWERDETNVLNFLVRNLTGNAMGKLHVAVTAVVAAATAAVVVSFQNSKLSLFLQLLIS